MRDVRPAKFVGTPDATEMHVVNIGRTVRFREDGVLRFWTYCMKCVISVMGRRYTMSAAARRAITLRNRSRNARTQSRQRWGQRLFDAITAHRSGVRRGVVGFVFCVLQIMPDSCAR
ncbi:MAG: hypothetical protein V3T53_11100 [Phycisphaerales bacterium]